MKSFARVLALLAAVGLTLLGVATAAGAAPYTTQLTVGASDSSPNPGQSITTSGHGATSNGQVSIDFHSAVTHLATVTANAAGDYTATVTIPANACGAHSIVATDVATGRTASTAVTLPACSTGGGGGTGGGGLSATGVAVAGIGGLGVVLLVGGGLLLMLGRRRRATV